MQLSDGQDFSKVPVLDIEPGYKYKITGFDDDDDKKFSVPMYDQEDNTSKEDFQTIMKEYQEKSTVMLDDKSEPNVSKNT